MSNYRVPSPTNEPVKSYAPNSPERAELLAALKELKSKQIDIPMIIGGQEIRTGKTKQITSPHNHKQVLATFHEGGEMELQLAIDKAVAAQQQWADMPWEHRAAIFLKAADLLAGPYRAISNAAAMLAHSKNIFQAEIDAVCELADFWRYNVHFAEQIYNIQPNNAPQIWDRTDHRPLEGFVCAITPFNFISINGNLPTAPAIMGNVAVWKPANTAVYTSYFIMKILREAGLPDGVINMVFAPGALVSKLVFTNKHFAGLHFTGSTNTFQTMWKTIAENLPNYRAYPRIVGETGGKDFILAHPSADVDTVVTAIVRGAFEFQGQKCSAASRCYLPKSLWPQMKDKLVEQVKGLKMGDPEDFTNFVNSVIDESAFKSITGYIDHAKQSADAEIIVGGEYDGAAGWFIRPTVVVTTNPHYKLLEEEIFGPVITIYVYDDAKYEETIRLIDSTSPYALTGAVISTDRQAIIMAEHHLRHAAGNFYINDKPTGAVVGQQPFGGGRASGTNDKAGGIQNMLRWTSPRSIKENFVPPKNYKYPFMEK